VTRVRFARIFWIGAAGILVLAALVGLVAVLGGDFSDTDARILVSLGVLLYAGGALLSALALIERHTASWLGWVVVAAAPIALGIVLTAVWQWVDEGDNEDLDLLAWSSVILLLAGLMATTALLLGKTPAAVRLAWTAGGLAAIAAVLSVAAIWEHGGADAFAKTIAVFWILAALAYFLVPIVERFSRSARKADERTLAALGDVELVATRSRDGLEVRLAPGERLLLRRRD
jgi:hypothetical protein